MNKKIVEIGLVAALLVVIGVSCGSDDESERTTAEQVVAVMTRTVEASDLDITKTYTGSLEGTKQAEISCKIGEAVNKIHVREGDRVNANQVIVSLDKSGPSSNYQQTMAVFRNAEKQHNRMSYLYEEGAVSEADADAARTEYEVAKAAFEAASRLVNLRSPIAGTVTSINVSSGSYLNVGQIVATVANVEWLRIRFGINTSDIELVSLDDSVKISVAAIGIEGMGVVTAVARSADPATRAYEVEATLDNSQGLFTPGMFARVSLIVERLDNVLAIPRSAVLNLGGNDVVYVVDGDEAERRIVQLGPEVDGSVIIEAGLEVGDVLVTLGQDYLDDGVKVNVTGSTPGE